MVRADDISNRPQCLCAASISGGSAACFRCCVVDSQSVCQSSRCRRYPAGSVLTFPLSAHLPRCHAGRCAAGYGLTFVLMQNRIRFGLHKFAKEGLVCLLESCTAKEAEQVGATHKGYLHMPDAMS
jgi:hypothetical protein